MAPRATRSKGAPPAPADQQPEAQAPQLSPSEPNPPHVVVLPKHASKDARFVSLVNPSTGTLQRYYYCPKAGIHELKQFTAPHDTPRSWLLASKPRAPTQPSSGYILKDARILMATQLDPLFLLLPLFNAAAAGAKPLAQPEDDHFDALAQTCENIKTLLKTPDFRQLLRSRMSACCSLADVDGEEVYRPDVAKLSRSIFLKAERMVRPGAWAASLEKEQVVNRLEAPYLPVVAESLDTEQQPEAPQGERVENSPANQAPLAPLPAVVDAQRLKTALQLILDCYVPFKLRPAIWKSIKTEKWVDFTDLEAHLAAVDKRKCDVQALRSISDNISRKRGPELDDEQAEIRAEKKRKKDEEEKKKKTETKAMKDLKKVNTSGMQKLSSFFSKASAKAKS